MAEFHGQGVMNRGQLTVGRDFNIVSRNNDTLRKIRSTDPRDDKVRIEQQKGGLLRDSYIWILSHKDFLKWRDSEGYQLLWVRGDPGKGKTMLLCGVIDELNNTRKPDWNIAYFFCQGTNYQLRKASFVLQGLIFSLLSQQDGLLECVREDIEQASGEMFRDLNGWAALCRIFGRLVEEMERRQQTTYLIVDGLDECLEDRRHLLKWIAALSAPSIKLLISSRNWPLIEDGLSGATQKSLLPLELNDQSISAAVDHYIDHKVMELEISKGLGPEPREAIRRHLKSSSNNTFLWVALVCEELGCEDTHPWKVLDIIHEFPPGLDELYERMAAHILASTDAKICCQVLSIQTLAYRPLTLVELLSIARLPKEFVESWLQKIVELCGSFLTVKNNTIYFVHQSAKDYLIKSMPKFLFLSDRVATGHRAMAIQAIQVLAETLRENMYELPSLGSRIGDFNAPEPDPLSGIRYACMYWVDHMIDAGLLEKKNVEHGDLVYRFLKKHLLHWFEALSLLKSLGLGIKALTRILFHMQALQNLIYDAWRVLRLHKVGIETAPLQVYTSALIFTPTQSLVKQIFFRKPEWLVMAPRAESYWDSPWLQTLEGHGKIKYPWFSGLLNSRTQNLNGLIYIQFL
ncbi:NACHT domain-containing protein [Nemania diffusa]|nr:NACHT domain-containing protein [Nemania diffusa]